MLSIRANVETARNALASARIAKNAAETSLAVLLGRSPAEIMTPDKLKAPASLMTSLDTTPALPSASKVPMNCSWRSFSPPSAPMSG